MNAQSPQDQLQVLRSAHSPSAQEGAEFTLPPYNPLWQLACVAAVLPGVIHYLQKLLADSPRGLSQEQVQVQF